MHGGAGVTDRQGVRQLSLIVQLTSLHLCHSTWLDADYFKGLSTLTNLQVLNMQGCKGSRSASVSPCLPALAMNRMIPYNRYPSVTSLHGFVKSQNSYSIEDTIVFYCNRVSIFTPCSQPNCRRIKPCLHDQTLEAADGFIVYCFCQFPAPLHVLPFDTGLSPVWAAAPSFGMISKEFPSVFPVC